MKRFACLLIVAAAVAAVPIHTAEAARRAFVIDQTGVPVTNSDGSSPTLEETRAAIIAGAAKHHWVVKEDAPGNIKLQLTNGGATVLVDVPYRAGSFDTRYLSSEGLKYSTDANGRRTIHASYRRWVDNLAGVKSVSVRITTNPTTGPDWNGTGYTFAGVPHEFVGIPEFAESTSHLADFFLERHVINPKTYPPFGAGRGGGGRGTDGGRGGRQ